MSIDINLKILSFHRRLSISREWIRHGIVAFVVVTTFVAAYWGPLKILVLFLAALGGTTVLIATFRYRNLCFILILLAGMFVPFSGPGGMNASILAIVFLMALWIMDMFVVKRRFQFVRSRAILPVSYFIVVSTIAFGMGQIPWFVFANQAPLDAQMGGFAIYFLLPVTMIMMANLVQELRWLEAIVWTFVGLGTLYVFGRALNLPIVTRLYQHGFQANSMFWLWLSTLPLAQAIFNKTLSLRARILLYGLVALTFYVSFAQQLEWKSGWVPATVAAGTLVALRFRRLALLSSPFFIIMAIYLAQDLISTDLYSWGTRVEAWLIVLEISRVSPLIGLGFANYYWYAPLFPIRGYAVEFNSHSQFVDIIAQAGLVGLLCFAWIFVEMIRLAWKLMNELPDGFAKGYAHGMMAGVFGSLMAAFLVDWLLPFAYNIGLDGVRASILPWIFFGGLISVEQIYLGNSITKREEASSRWIAAY